MRAVYLLYRDGRVTKSKKSIASLQASGLLNGVKYALLPVTTKKSIYVAVLGDFLNAEIFHPMTVRMHMQLLCGYADSRNEIRAPWEFDENIIFDYYTTTMEVKSWEELYHIIHMAMTNSMVEHLQESGATLRGHIGNAYTCPIYYFRIEDMSIRALDGEGKDIIEPFEFSMQAMQYGTNFEDRLGGVPLAPDGYTSGNTGLCELLAERFGIYHKSVGSGWNWSIRENENGVLSWREENRIGNLYSDVKKVIFSSADIFSSFMMLSDDDYDQLIRAENGDLFVIPLIFAPEEYTEEKPPYDMLTPTTCYEVPRYEFTDDNDSTIAFQNCLAMMDSYMAQTIESFDFHDPHEIAFMIAYLQDLMEVVCEACKVECATRFNTNDLLGLSSWCTVMIDCILEISESSPATKYLHIMTDRYQDVPVDVPTVCYLLSSEEKTH